MATPNFVDKTIWTGDNLDILRGMNSECVDLIYLDPPFNSNRNYAAPIGRAAAGAAFECQSWRGCTTQQVNPASKRRDSMKDQVPKAVCAAWGLVFIGATVLTGDLTGLWGVPIILALLP